MKQCLIACAAWLCLAGDSSLADDWARFRGPHGSGIAADSEAVPTEWSPSNNLAWKLRLPGPGASSPIIVDGKVLVTCYSGYGVTRERQGNVADLTRHLVCINVKTGEKMWQRDVLASLPEDSYYDTGVSSHGYATHTPVSDGDNVYVFFGKGGVLAFDLNGNELWRADAGSESDPPKWGSSCSPILFEDIVIVTAAAEGQAIIGFDKKSGQQLWREEAKGLDGMWGTPALVKVDQDRTDLVMLVAGELWGLDPRSGKLRWYTSATSSQQAYTSIIQNGTRVFAFSGQGGGSLALDVGGTGEIADRVIWNGPVTATYASPVMHDSRIYVVSRGILTVADANTGVRLKQLRLKGARQTGGPFGSLDYASPVIVGDRLFYLNASGQTYVFGLGSELTQLAVNEVTSGKEFFWGSPAVSDGRMVLKSSESLYCIAHSGDTVNQVSTLPADGADTSTSAREPRLSGRQGEDGGRISGGPRSGRDRPVVRDPDRPQRPRSINE